MDSACASQIVPRDCLCVWNTSPTETRASETCTFHFARLEVNNVRQGSGEGSKARASPACGTSMCNCGATIADLLTSGCSRALPRRGRPGEREIRVESHTANEDFRLELVAFFVLVIFLGYLERASLHPIILVTVLRCADGDASCYAEKYCCWLLLRRKSLSTSVMTGVFSLVSQRGVKHALADSSHPRSTCVLRRRSSPIVRRWCAPARRQL